jgi:hypothetical protein
VLSYLADTTLVFRGNADTGPTRAYETKTDEELMQLAMESEQLTLEAHSALTTELARRRIGGAEHLKVQERGDQGGIERQGSLGQLTRPESRAVGEFIADVFQIYHGQLWLFVKLTGPAVVVGYLALTLGRNEGREIARHLPRGVAILGHQTELFEIRLANTAGYFVSWMASCFSFGAISSAVGQHTAGGLPSASECLAEVRELSGPFVRLSLLLFVLLLVGMAAAGSLGTGVLVSAPVSPSLWHLDDLDRIVCFFWINVAGLLTLWTRGACARTRRSQCLPGNVPQ